MKKVSFLLLAVFLSVQNLSYASVEVLDGRIEDSRRVLREAMASPDQSIPEELLANAEAIAIYPNVLNGAFIVGARWGTGIVVRRDPKTNEWGPVAFSSIGGGSIGLQIGGQQTDVILVILNERGLNGLLNNNFTLGVDAAAAAGPVGRKTEVATDLSLQASIYAYARSRGLFAGIAVDGAVLTQDNGSNSTYYGKEIGTKEILLERQVEPKASSSGLLADLKDYSSRWDKRSDESKKSFTTPASTPDREADYEGEIESIDSQTGEFTVIDLRPMDKRKAGAAAEKKIRAESWVLAGLKLGDRVKVYLDEEGRNDRAIRIIKVK